MRKRAGIFETGNESNASVFCASYANFAAFDDLGWKKYHLYVVAYPAKEYLDAFGLDGFFCFSYLLPMLEHCEFENE